MSNFLSELFSWIGFIFVAWFVIMYFLYNKFPKILIEIQKPQTFIENTKNTTNQQPSCKEPFAVDLNAYTSTLPTVYSKNCAFTGIKPQGYIPNISDWQKYSGYLP